MTDRIRYIDLKRQHEAIFGEIQEKVEEVLLSGTYILGKEVEEFEKSFSQLVETKYCVGVSNGTDALVLILKAVGIKNGDEVIVPGNSFLASASSVVLAGGRPIFCDVKSDFNICYKSVKNSCTKKTKAIMAVHLTGRPADMDKLREIAKEKSLILIEDAAQAAGARYKDKPVGGLSEAAAFSMHPLKNLSACGDAGVVTTNNEEIYNKVKLLRNHGLQDRNTCVEWGYNQRLDALQAGILNVKLKYLKKWNEQRRANAAFYSENLSEFLEVPTENSGFYGVYEKYQVLTDRRDELKNHLDQDGIDALIHYPVPLYRQPVAAIYGYKEGDFPEVDRQTKKILSLPVHQFLTESEKERIVKSVLAFFKGRS